MKIKKRTFGVLPNGKKVSLYTVSNGQMSFSVTDFGCSITSIVLPSANGKKDDIALGFSSLDGYIRNPVFFGCLVGRYANRISGAAFSLGGETFRLTDNDHGACLHGGKPGYHKQVWKSEAFSNPREVGVVFKRLSEAGEQGFPGNVELRVSYSLTAQNEIILRYTARTDAPTPVNLTNHTYFNLAGHGAGSILDHQVQLFADRYTPVNAAAIPSGEIAPVAGTPFDFRSPKPIGRDIESVSGGYDHNWEINRAGDTPNPVAGVYEPVSGRTLTVYSTQPGVQFYTGNFLNGVDGKDGEVYGKQGGFCLETQHFPDSPNRKEFPNTILLPGDTYRQQTIWHFGFGR
jgi:aldose 1-epimerase